MISMMFREYYDMEQDLIKRIENEKKFSLRKVLMLIELSSLSLRTSYWSAHAALPRILQ